MRTEELAAYARLGETKRWLARLKSRATQFNFNAYRGFKYHRLTPTEFRETTAALMWKSKITFAERCVVVAMLGVLWARYVGTKPTPLLPPFDGG